MLKNDKKKVVLKPFNRFTIKWETSVDSKDILSAGALFIFIIAAVSGFLCLNPAELCHKSLPEENPEVFFLILYLYIVLSEKWPSQSRPPQTNCHYEAAAGTGSS